MKFMFPRKGYPGAKTDASGLSLGIRGSGAATHAYEEGQKRRHRRFRHLEV